MAARCVRLSTAMWSFAAMLGTAGACTSTEDATAPEPSPRDAAVETTPTMSPSEDPPPEASSENEPVMPEPPSSVADASVPTSLVDAGPRDAVPPEDEAAAPAATPPDGAAGAPEALGADAGAPTAALPDDGAHVTWGTQPGFVYQFQARMDLGGRVSVAWLQVVPGEQSVWFRRHDPATGWLEPRRVGEYTGDELEPSVDLAVNHLGDAAIMWPARDDDEGPRYTRVARYLNDGTLEELPPIADTYYLPHINDAGYVITMPGNLANFTLYHHGPGDDGWQATSDFFTSDASSTSAVLVSDQRGNSSLLWFDDANVRLSTFAAGAWSHVQLGPLLSLQSHLDLVLAPPDGYFAAWQPRSGAMLLSRYLPESGWEPAVEVTDSFDGIPPISYPQRDYPGRSAATVDGDYVLVGSSQHLYVHDDEMTVHSFRDAIPDEFSSAWIPKVGPALDVVLCHAATTDLGRDLYLQRWSPSAPTFTERQLVSTLASSQLDPEPLVDAEGRVFLVWVDEISGRLSAERFDP